MQLYPEVSTDIHICLEISMNKQRYPGYPEKSRDDQRFPEVLRDVQIDREIFKDFQ